MTEAEWLRSVYPRSMVRFARTRGSDRIWRLYAVACLWEVSDLLTRPGSRRALGVAERFADGAVAVEDLAAARALAETAAREAHREEWEDEARSNFHCTPTLAALHKIALAAEGAHLCVAEEVDIENLYQGFLSADLLREVFGNPFRWKEVEPAWLTWNDGVVRNLAETIYEERVFDRLPILGDALEEAGCGDVEILTHCRSDGPHVRGCWVLDLILGKE